MLNLFQDKSLFPTAVRDSPFPFQPKGFLSKANYNLLFLTIITPMNYMLKKLAIFLFLTTGVEFGLHAQCDVRIHVATNQICLGDTLPMSAKGGCGVAFFADFNDSTLQGLTSNNTQWIGSPCTSSLDSSRYLWMGTVAGQSLVYTQNMNLTTGSYTISFEMKYGEDGSSTLCDGPSTTAESVHLQYSINNGANWVDIQYWDPNGGHDANLIYWKKYIIALPVGAKTAATRFRWAQQSVNPANTSCWGLDNIMIQKYVPTQFVWSTAYIGAVHPPVSPLNTTTYHVTATAGSVSSEDSVTIYVSPRPTSDYITSRPLCKSELIDFIYTGNGDTTSTFQWSFAQAFQQIDTNKANAFASWNKSGQYTVSLLVTQGGCASMPTSKELLIAPLISFYISASQGCEPMEVNYTGNVEPLHSSYLWDFHDGGTDTAVNPTHIYQVAGNYGLTLIATTDSGCVDTISFPVLTKVYPNPLVDFTWTPDIIPWSNPLATFMDKSTYGNAYQWDFGDPAGGSSNAKNPTHSYSDKGLFDVWLKVTSEHGCLDSTMKSIRVVDDEFEVPNVITPNGDGFNDIFKITNLESLKYCKIEVFNRWGKLVYQHLNYQNDWKAENLSDGIYYYHITYESWFDVGELHGFFHVIRSR